MYQWENNKRPNIHVNSVPEEKEKRKGVMFKKKLKR